MLVHLSIYETRYPTYFPADKMYLHATFILAVLSSFVQTTPTPFSGGAIPIRKRTHVRDANDVVDVTTLLRNIRYTTSFVFSTMSIQVL